MLIDVSSSQVLRRSLHKGGSRKTNGLSIIKNCLKCASHIEKGKGEKKSFMGFWRGFNQAKLTKMGPIATNFTPKLLFPAI